MAEHVTMMVVMFISLGLSGIALFSWSRGWFWWFLLVEVMVVAGLYAGMRVALGKIRWEPAE